jgi:hypothetical protein
MTILCQGDFKEEINMLYCYSTTVKVNVKVTLEQATKALSGSKGIALLFS